MISRRVSRSTRLVHQDLDGEYRKDTREGVIDAAQDLSVRLQPAGQEIRAIYDAEPIGSDRMIDQRPRKISLPVTCGSSAVTNCGRKVMKKMMTLGSGD